MTETPLTREQVESACIDACRTYATEVNTQGLRQKVAGIPERLENLADIDMALVIGDSEFPIGLVNQVGIELAKAGFPTYIDGMPTTAAFNHEHDIAYHMGSKRQREGRQDTLEEFVDRVMKEMHHVQQQRDRYAASGVDFGAITKGTDGNHEELVHSSTPFISRVKPPRNPTQPDGTSNGRTAEPA